MNDCTVKRTDFLSPSNNPNIIPKIIINTNKNHSSERFRAVIFWLYNI